MDNRIRIARKVAGITQEQLAKSLGVNRATLSRYESGEIDPPSSQLQRIADTLDVSINELLGQGEAKQMSTGQRIRVARKKAGITQADLANKLDIPFQSISQWERDIRKPKMETLQKIADALDIDVFELVQIESTPNHPGSEGAVAELVEKMAQAKQEGKEIRAYNGGLYVVTSTEDTPPPDKIRLDIAFSQLNPTGQSEAVKRVEELTEIPRYQKEKSPADGE